MSIIKDYKTGYGGVTDSFIRKELETFAKDYHTEQCNGVLPCVSGSYKSLPIESIKEFIKHWQRIISPVDLEHLEKRSIHTVITELGKYAKVHCR